MKVLSSDVPPSAIWYQDERAILHQLVKTAMPNVGNPASGLDINERREIVCSDEIVVRQGQIQSPSTSVDNGVYRERTYTDRLMTSHANKVGFIGINHVPGPRDVPPTQCEPIARKLRAGFQHFIKPPITGVRDKLNAVSGTKVTYKAVKSTYWPAASRVIS